MFLRRLVYLGSDHVLAAGAAGSGREKQLRYEGVPLEDGDVLQLVRKRSSWSRHRDVERVLLGSHPGRADVLLAGEGLQPEHVRFYLPKEAAGPNDLKVICESAVRVNGREADPHQWYELKTGDELLLASWHFRFEQFVDTNVEVDADLKKSTH